MISFFKNISNYRCLCIFLQQIDYMEGIDIGLVVQHFSLDDRVISGFISLIIFHKLGTCLVLLIGTLEESF